MRSNPRLEALVLESIPFDGGVRSATQIWETTGGRHGLMGLVGPSITGVMTTLERLANDGRVRERRVECAPGRFLRIYDRPAPEAGPDS